MKPPASASFFAPALALVFSVFAWTPGAFSVPTSAPVTESVGESEPVQAVGNGPRVIEAKGRVLVRAAGGTRYRGRARPGLALFAGDALVTGPEARVELGFGSDTGRWRVGQQAIWRSLNSDGDAVLQAGAALVAVPPGCGVRVEGVNATVRLGAGVWLLTAVLNNGFKVVALDKGVLWRSRAPSEAAGDTPPETAGTTPRDRSAEERKLSLRAGEVVFLPPGSEDFGPVVTVFLDELLATSRLVGGFASELPQAERLRQQGAAQREALRNVSNAFVGGAPRANGFQLVVPKTPATASPSENPTPAGK